MPVSMPRGRRFVQAATQPDGAPSTPPTGTRFSTGEDVALLAGPATSPPGAVVVTPGISSDLGSLTNANPAGTTFYLLAGHHVLGGSTPGGFAQVTPKNGNTYIGAPGAVLDGRLGNFYAFTGTATDVRIAYLEIINFRAFVEQLVVNHDGGDNWTIEYCHIHHNKGGAVGVSSGSMLRYSWIHHNSQYAFSAVGAAVNEGVTTANQNITAHHCEIAYNGDQKDEMIEDGSGNPTGGGRNGGCKFWDSGPMDVYSNWVHHSNSVGIWADTNNIDLRLEGNLIEDNHGEGLFYEISWNFLVKDNTFRRNALRKGFTFNNRGDNFPVPAIYISESGSEPRRTGYRYGSVSEITGNTFINNINDVALWENADRFCNSGGNTSNKIWTPLGGVASLAVCNSPSTHAVTVNLTSGSPVFTVVGGTGTFYWNDEGQFISGTGIPAGTQIEPPLVENGLNGGWTQYSTGLTGKMTANATQTGTFVMTFAAGSISTEPALSDCRWRTQNVHVHDNVFQHNRSEVLGARNTLASGVQTGKHSLLSNSGYGPVVWWGSPYTGDTIKTRITGSQNNVWANNSYKGSTYNWQPFDPGVSATFSQWRTTWGQDAGSTLDTTDPVTGFANTTIYLPDPPASVTAVAGNGQAKVSFTPCPDYGGDQIVGYTVTSSPGGFTASTRGNPAIITGLTNGTAYTFTVKSRSSMGLGAASAASSAVTPTSGSSFSSAIIPCQCTDVIAYQQPNGDVEVSFFDPIDPGSSPVTSYTVTASPGGATATTAVPPATFTGLAAGTYTFTARATSADGTGPDSPASPPFTLTS